MLGVDGVASAQATTVPEKDAAEIRAELQGMQDAWNRHDMKAFVSCMSDDVEWVNGVGMWWKGKDQVLLIGEGVRFARSANNPPFAMRLQRMGHPVFSFGFFFFFFLSFFLLCCCGGFCFFLILFSVYVTGFVSFYLFLFCLGEEVDEVLLPDIGYGVGAVAAGRVGDGDEDEFGVGHLCD